MITYALSPNRQRPLAGVAHAAIFNVWRRFSHQVLYIAPPILIAYAAMNWAVERYVGTGCCLAAGEVGLERSVLTWDCRNEYLNSKPGRLAEGGAV